MKSNVIVLRKNQKSDDLYELVKHELRSRVINDIALQAEVSPTTLRNWGKGKTKSPQLYKIVSVLQALGYVVRAQRP